MAPGTYGTLFRAGPERVGLVANSSRIRDVQRISQCAQAGVRAAVRISGGRGQNREQQQAGTAHTYSLEPAEAASIIGNASFLRAWALCRSSFAYA